MAENDIIPLIRDDKVLAQLKQLSRLFIVLLVTEELPAKKEQSLVSVFGSVYYLIRMILTRLWRKAEITNPYENIV